MILTLIAWTPAAIASAITLRRFWRCGILGFWLPVRVRDRQLRGHLLARDADYQHAALLAGNTQGVYGNYPPAELS